MAAARAAELQAAEELNHLKAQWELDKASELAGIRRLAESKLEAELASARHTAEVEKEAALFSAAKAADEIAKLNLQKLTRQQTNWLESLLKHGTSLRKIGLRRLKPYERPQKAMKRQRFAQRARLSQT